MKSKEIGKRIRGLMIVKGLSGKELARKMSMPPSHLSERLSGKRQIQIDELPEFAKALDASVYFLWTGHDIRNRSAVKETGLSNETITRIRNLDEKKKRLLEMLINDDGSVILKKDSKSKNDDFVKNPIPEPEYGFLDALSNYANSPKFNQIVEIMEDSRIVEDFDENSVSDVPPAKTVIRQLPLRYRIRLADGSLHDVSEWKPDSNTLLKRLQLIRKKYLNGVEKEQNNPVEEDDEE